MPYEYKVGDRVQLWGTRREQTGRRKRRKGVLTGVVLEVYIDMLRIQWQIDGKDQGEPDWYWAFRVEPADEAVLTPDRKGA